MIVVTTYNIDMMFGSVAIYIGLAFVTIMLLLPVNLFQFNFQVYQLAFM